MYSITPEQVSVLASQVLDNEIKPSHLSDTELTLVHAYLLLAECALPPAALVADEVARRMEVKK